MSDATPGLSLYAVRMRVARLDASGVPLVGADNLYVTSKMVRVDYEPTYNTTSEVTKPNGSGGLCLNIPAKDKITGVSLTVEICEDDPALYEMLGGGSVITAGSGSDIIGYQGPKSTDPDDNMVSIEVWTKALVDSVPDIDLPYFWYPFPACSLHQNARSLAADPDKKEFVGNGRENPNWGTGPTYDYAHDSSASFQWIRTATLPAVTNGYAPIIADS